MDKNVLDSQIVYGKLDKLAITKAILYKFNGLAKIREKKGDRRFIVFFTTEKKRNCTDHNTNNFLATPVK